MSETLDHFHIDDDLQELTTEELGAVLQTEIRKWAAELPAPPQQMINIPAFDTACEVSALQMALVEAGIVTVERLDELNGMFRVTQMRKIRKDIVPDFQKERARAAILDGIHAPGIPRKGG